MPNTQNSRNNKSRISNTSSSKNSAQKLAKNVLASIKPQISSHPVSSNRQSSTISKKKVKSKPGSRLSMRKPSGSHKKVTFSSDKKAKTVSVFQNLRLETPICPIKFKESKKKPSAFFTKYPSTQDNFFIQYDEPEQLDMSIIENPKKFMNSHKDRVLRYGKKTALSIPEVKDPLFIEAITKLFRLLDEEIDGSLSEKSVDRRRIPEAALYFLGGLFQKIRQKQLTFSLGRFIQECSKVHMCSSQEDIKWFIKDVLELTSRKETEGRISLSAKGRVLETSGRTDTNSFMMRESTVEEKIQIPSSNSSRNQQKKSILSNNFSFDQENSNISFRKNSSKLNQSGQSVGEDSSFHSAKFYLNQSKDSRKSSETGTFTLSTSILKQNPHTKNAGIYHEKQRIQPSQKVFNKPDEPNNTVMNKPQDLRDQIYAKLNRMRFVSENPKEPHQEGIIKSNFKQKKDHSESILHVKFALDDDKFAQEGRILKQMAAKKRIQAEKGLEKPKWEAKTSNIQKSYSQMKNLQSQFNKHKEVIQKREKERENFYKQQASKISSKFDPANKQNSPNETSSLKSSGYQKNAERLSMMTVNLTCQKNKIMDLGGSCRKAVDISLPLKVDFNRSSGEHAFNRISTAYLKAQGSQKSDKVDKIDQLSQKIEKYLQKNAQKIEISKNFTNNHTLEASRRFAPSASR